MTYIVICCFHIESTTSSHDSNKENIPPVQDQNNEDDDSYFDFDGSSFKYDNEYSSEEDYYYSDNDSDAKSCASHEVVFQVDTNNERFIDQCPGHTQVLRTLESSSEDSQCDSCHKQGYDYDEHDIDGNNDNDSYSSNDDKSYSGFSSDDDSSSSSSSSDSDASNGASTRNNASSMNTRNKGGRPLGSTIDKQQQQILQETKAKYKIVCRFTVERHTAREQGLTQIEMFNNILEEERINHGLSDSFMFSYFTALSRIRRKNLNATGTGSPLLEIEDELVDLILCMSKIKRSLSVTEGLHLCNQLISDTDIQKKLIDFKLNRNIFTESPEDLGRVGRHYWKKFLKRNKQKIRSKTPKKFALDRTQWTTYMNFDDMYRHVEEVMIESNIAERLPEPLWMDASGRVVDNEHQASGCKVEIKVWCQVLTDKTKTLKLLYIVHMSHR